MVDPPFTLYMKNGSSATTINMYKIRKNHQKYQRICIREEEGLHFEL